MFKSESCPTLCAVVLAEVSVATLQQFWDGLVARCGSGTESITFPMPPVCLQPLNNQFKGWQRWSGMDLCSHSDTWFPIQWAKVDFLLKASWQPVAFPPWPQVVCTDLFLKPDSNMTLFSNFIQDCILIFYWFDCIFISDWWPEKWSWWCTILNTRAQYFSIYWVRSEMRFTLFLFTTLCSSLVFFTLLLLFGFMSLVHVWW